MTESTSPDKLVNKAPEPELTESARIRHTMLLCEVAIGEVGAATMTPANADVLLASCQWLQAMHTNIETALKKALEDEKNEMEKKAPAAQPELAQS